MSERAKREIIKNNKEITPVIKANFINDFIFSILP
jgi:hypothetical protein